MTAYAESPTSLRVSWRPPPADRRNGAITYYKLFVAQKPESAEKVVEIPADRREFVVEDLRTWTEYKVWMIAGTQIGDGPASEPITVKTDEDGKPMKLSGNSGIPARQKGRGTGVERSGVRKANSSFRGRVIRILSPPPSLL